MAVCMLFFQLLFAGLMTLLLKYVMMKEEVNPLFATLVQYDYRLLLCHSFGHFVRRNYPWKHQYVITSCYGYLHFPWLDVGFSISKHWEGKEATVVGTFDKASTILTILLSVIFLNEN